MVIEDLQALLPDEFHIGHAQYRVGSTESLVKRIFTLVKDEARFRDKAVRDDYKRLIEEAEKEVGIKVEHAWSEYWESLDFIEDLKSKLKRETDCLVCQEYVKQTEDAERDAQKYFDLADMEDALKGELREIEQTVNEVGGLCVVFMDSELHSLLRFLLRTLGKEKPAENLWNLEKQYKKTFRLDFTRSKKLWPTVKLLHKARNRIIHHESVADSGFRKIVRYPLLIEGNKIVIGRRNFDDCVQVFSGFASFVVKSVEESKGLKKQ